MEHRGVWPGAYRVREESDRSGRGVQVELEPTILQRIASGDSSAVKECVDTYGNLVWSIARRMGPSTMEAEDVVQEIFVDLWKSAGRFKPETASETTFVAMIARRRLIDRIRSAKRAAPTVAISEGFEIASDDHHHMERNIEAQMAARALSTLRGPQREAVLLSVLHGLPHAEIAQQLEIPLGTVKSYIRRGLVAVRASLGVTPEGQGASL